FVVESALEGMPLFKGQSARERAIDVFAHLRIWETEHNNGVLIYLLLADRDVEIVADRSIHAKVGAQEWEHICRVMEAHLSSANYKGAVVDGIQAVTQHLIRYFPVAGAGQNELPDIPVVL
ncbi:MAG: TPM domain-containing protein, partial [Fimbriimonadaceae bacterium]